MNSVIVIDKSNRTEPFSEIRKAGEPRATSYLIPEGYAPSELEELRIQIDAMRQSTSWRLTAPLRSLTTALRRYRAR